MLEDSVPPRLNRLRESTYLRMNPEEHTSGAEARFDPLGCTGDKSRAYRPNDVSPQLVKAASILLRCTGDESPAYRERRFPQLVKPASILLRCAGMNPRPNARTTFSAACEGRVDSAPMYRE